MEGGGGGGKLLSEEDEKGLTSIKVVDSSDLPQPNKPASKPTKKPRHVVPPARPKLWAKVFRQAVKEAKTKLKKATVKPDPPITLHVLSTKPRPPSYKIHFRSSDITQRWVTPGPGAYTIPENRVKASPRFMAPVKRREGPDFLRKGMSCSPGPAAYLPLGDSGRGKGCSLSSRLEIRDESNADAPGPASYNIPSCFGHEGRAWSMTGKGYHRAPYETTPGPGAYHPTPPEMGSTRGVSFSSRWRPPSPPDGPGPGAYEPKQPHGRPVGVTLKGRIPYNLPLKGQGPPSTYYNLRPPTKDPLCVVAKRQARLALSTSPHP
eukprot:Sspe_Gene.81552::Locus_52400_Transcript_1_1_Confidence_1.000_Length_1060::g.81552::m.81552